MYHKKNTVNFFLPVATTSLEVYTPACLKSREVVTKAETDTHFTLLDHTVKPKHLT